MKTRRARWAVRTHDIGWRIIRQENVPLLIVLLTVSGVFAVLTSGVTNSFDGIHNILSQGSVRGITAVGQTFVILTGGIDLSIYGIGALAGFVGAGAMTSRADQNLVGGYVFPMELAIVCMLLVGLAFGSINGLLVSRARIPALIVTFGTWQIGYGAAMWFGRGTTIIGLPERLNYIGQQTYLGIAAPVWLMFVCFIVGYYILHYTQFGRAVYAVGGNATSARLCGIDVGRVQLMVFAISGFTTALASVALEGRLMSVSLRNMMGQEIDTISAVAVGGVSIYGGRGSIISVLLGVLIIGVLDSGLSTLGATPDVMNTVKGGIIITAVAVDYLRRRRQA